MIAPMLVNAQSITQLVILPAGFHSNTNFQQKIITFKKIEGSQRLEIEIQLKFYSTFRNIHRVPEPCGIPRISRSEK
jgi:hypothetical protein